MMSMTEKIDWDKLKELEKTAAVVLSYDLSELRHRDARERAAFNIQLQADQRAFEREFLSKLARDIREEITSQFTLARLLLSTAARENEEESPIIADFREKELSLLPVFEKYSVFDILNSEEIAERIRRKEDIYDLVMEYQQKEYTRLDDILDDTAIRKDLRIAFKKRYLGRLKKVEEGMQAYVAKYGLIIVVSQIEKKFMDNLKKSEEARRQMAQSLEQDNDKLYDRLKPLPEMEQKSEAFKSKLDSLQDQMLTGAGKPDVRQMAPEKDALAAGYLKLEQELASQMESLEQKRKEMEAREAELEKAKQEYRQQMQEEKQRLVEGELKELQALKNELAAQQQTLQDEKTSVEVKRQEITERLRQLDEAAEGKPIRFISRQDARLCELNFIARFDTKMQTYPVKLYSAVEKKSYDIRSWKEGEHLSVADRSAPDTPWNVRSCYTVQEKKHLFFGEKVKKIVVEAISFNHLEEFEQYGYDARRANLADFLKLITRYIDRAELGKYLHVIGVASATGWDEKVLDEVKSTGFAHNYISRFVSFCLVDAVTGEAVYNPSDDRIAGFIDYFKPEFDREKLEKVRKYVLDRLAVKEYVVFDEIATETGESRTIVNKVFYDLQREDKGKTRFIKEVGLVLQIP